MKILLIISALFISLNAFSQFPAPRNFEFQGAYITLGDIGYCAGKRLNGPADCSYFKWDKPDTSSTTSKLDFYKIYYSQTLSNDTIVITTLEDTAYTNAIGINGYVWVTAVYSSPEGESEASNAIFNATPLGFKTLNAVSNKSILFNKEQQTITVENVNNPIDIKVIDNNGKIVKTEKNRNTIDISSLPSGLYIIEVTDLDSKLIRQKITK